jgi:serine/threonine-protein kinase
LAHHDRKLDEYRVLSRLHDAGIRVNRPIDLGPCNDQQTGYLLCEWIEGEDLEGVLPHLSLQEQAQLGHQAGLLLAQVHRLAPLHPLTDWATHFNAKIDRKIAKALTCPVEIPGRDLLIQTLNADRHHLNHRPVTLHHGDFHIGNLLLQPDGQLALIDLNRFDAGDPWEEFNRIVWDAQASPVFASARIRAYFPHGIPDSFFPLMRLYVAANALSSVPWAIPFGDAEVQVMQHQLRDILSWYDGMTQTLPRWFIP